MVVRMPLAARFCAALLAVGLFGCGAAPQAPGAQAGATAGLPTPNPSLIAQAATAGAEAAVAATALAATAAAVVPTVAAAVPTALGGAGQVVPQATLDLIVADLADQLSVEPASISIVSAEAVSWPDGSLGCPQPGMMYPQVITEGFRVILAVDGEEYAFHGSDRGEFFYCENPA